MHRIDASRLPGLPEWLAKGWFVIKHRGKYYAARRVTQLKYSAYSLKALAKKIDDGDKRFWGRFLKKKVGTMRGVHGGTALEGLHYIKGQEA